MWGAWLEQLCHSGWLDEPQVAGWARAVHVRSEGVGTAACTPPVDSARRRRPLSRRTRPVPRHAPRAGQRRARRSPPAAGVAPARDPCLPARAQTQRPRTQLALWERKGWTRAKRHALPLHNGSLKCGREKRRVEIFPTDSPPQTYTIKL
eukprot:scaffold29843_cov63-Phaeocystis_antarctica.AAC.2